MLESKLWPVSPHLALAESKLLALAESIGVEALACVAALSLSAPRRHHGHSLVPPSISLGPIRSHSCCHPRPHGRLLASLDSSCALVLSRSLSSPLCRLFPAAQEVRCCTGRSVRAILQSGNSLSESDGCRRAEPYPPTPQPGAVAPFHLASFLVRCSCGPLLKPQGQEVRVWSNCHDSDEASSSPPGPGQDLRRKADCRAVNTRTGPLESKGQPCGLFVNPEQIIRKYSINDLPGLLMRGRLPGDEHSAGPA